MDKFDWFMDMFENNLDKDDQIEIFNQYCREYGCEDEIYQMSEFDEIFSGKKPSEVFQMVYSNRDEVNWNDEYFVVTIYGFQTFSDPYEFIHDYLGDIFNHMHLWEAKISIDDYIEDIYNGHFDLKPDDMDDDEFYDIVEDAVYSNDSESEIVDNIKKAVSEE